MTTHSSILAWRVPWTVYSPGGCKESDTDERLSLLSLSGGSAGKESVCQCRRPGFDLWVRKIPWRRAWHPLQYSCLENPVDREAWWATGHGVAESQTRLSD